MPYQIKVNYRTGDSFGSHDTSTTLECIWESLDLAKEALAAIKEHNSYYEQSENTYSRKSIDMRKFEKEVTGKYWYYAGFRGTEKFSHNMWYHSIKLKQDDGALKSTSCSWHGYFERLYGAEIVPVGLDEMRFTV